MMGEPNPNAKWSKYAIAEDGTLERKAEHCPVCGPVFSSLYTPIVRPVVDAVIRLKSNDATYHRLLATIVAHRS